MWSMAWIASYFSRGSSCSMHSYDKEVSQRCKTATIIAYLVNPDHAELPRRVSRLTAQPIRSFDRSNHLHSIVAIHGLGGHPFKT